MLDTIRSTEDRWTRDDCAIDDSRYTLHDLRLTMNGRSYISDFSDYETISNEIKGKD